MKTFSLIYTTIRPSEIGKVIHLWKSRAVNWEACEMIVTTDKGIGIPDYEAWKNDATLYIQEQRPFNCNRGWNLAAAKSTGRVIVLVSDDIVPPERWDEQLLKIDNGAWVDTEAVIHTSDGYDNKLTHAIITRKRYDRFGYFFHPAYESMWNDTELAVVAYEDKVVIDARHILIDHLHPTKGRRPEDEVDKAHGGAERFGSGKAIYERRRAKGFPVDAGPNAPYVAYFQVNKDDFFLEETAKRVVEQGVTQLFFHVPQRSWSGAFLDKSDSRELDLIMRRLSKVADVHYSPANPQQIGTDRRVDTETRVRNAALTEMRSLGFTNILIVDCDELWRPTVLDQIKAKVKEVATVISCPMIPVVGLPGYPVEGALDKAVVYYGGNEIIGSCRSPEIEPVPLEEIGIYHFSLVRKTLEEIVKKCRESGHYDDVEYDFEGFIKNKLPNIRPGERDIHMYRHRQIWPVIREWKAEELAEIPKVYHSYLGLPKTSNPKKINATHNRTASAVH